MIPDSYIGCRPHLCKELREIMEKNLCCCLNCKRDEAQLPPTSYLKCDKCGVRAADDANIGDHCPRTGRDSNCDGDLMDGTKCSKGVFGCLAAVIGKYAICGPARLCYKIPFGTVARCIGKGTAAALCGTKAFLCGKNKCDQTFI